MRVSIAILALLAFATLSADCKGDGFLESRPLEKRGLFGDLFGKKTTTESPSSTTAKQPETKGAEENVEKKEHRGLLHDIAGRVEGDAKKALESVKKLIGLAEKVVSEVNEKAKSWEAALTKFANFTKDAKQKLMGLQLDMAKDKSSLNKTDEGFLRVGYLNALTYSFSAVPSSSIPAQFDSRQKWPACAAVIGAIADQSSCGSCWAVSTASVYTDRLCIQMVKAGKKPDLKVRYSAADLMSCSTQNHGCDGGVPKYAWDFITKNGIATGSEWEEKAGCKPYPFPPNKFTNNENEQTTPKCTQSCTNSKYSVAYPKDKKYATNPTGWSGAGLVSRMQMEIMENGPINVGMQVHEDLMYYKSGVYHHVTGDSLGGHAVRIIGWGEASGQKYWLVANSWNTDWGEKGLFRIRRGSDEERIETLQIAFGTPKI